MKKKNVEEVIKPEEGAVKIKGTREPKVPGKNNDTKIILGIVGGMIILCLALIAYYFIGIDNQVLATYKGGEITRGEYTIYYKLFSGMLQYYGYTDEMIKEEVLNKAVIDEIVLAKAEKEKLKISDEKKDEIEEIFKDDEQISSFVEQGIDPEKMKDVYYDDALISAYIDKLTEKADEKTIKEFIDETEGEKANYNQYVTSYILFSKDGENGDLEKVKTKAQAALDRIKKGEDFAKVGEEIYSNDSTYTQYGADFTLYLNGSTVEAYQEAVRNLKVGQMTQELVESKEYGYFIIKLNSVVENDRIKGENAADNYVNELLANWQKEAEVKAKEKRINNVAASLNTAVAQ